MTETWTGPVADGGDSLPIRGRHLRFQGRVWSVVSDDVAFEDAVVRRDVIVHPGAVAVIALDDDDRVLLIRQYRHPVGRFLFEPPAGLLDVVDEPALTAAARELVEEAGLTADRWDVLLDQYLTPGGSSEAIRIYLARGLHSVPGGRPVTGEAEEQQLPQAWIDLDRACDLVRSGAVGSPTAVSGILAAWVARAAGWRGLRPADAPWPARAALLENDRLPPPPTRP